MDAFARFYRHCTGGVPLQPDQRRALWHRAGKETGDGSLVMGEADTTLAGGAAEVGEGHWRTSVRV